jgi:hypothetical protein
MTEVRVTEATSSGSGGDENLVEDYITHRMVPLTPKEEVRQRVAEALDNEYRLSPDDMLPDFPIQVQTPDGKIRRKRVEIAIFAHGQEKTVANLRRAVVVRPEPKNGHRAVTKLRDHEQAAKDLQELEAIMGAAPPAIMVCGPTGWTFSSSVRSVSGSRPAMKREPTGRRPRSTWTRGQTPRRSGCGGPIGRCFA